MKYLFARIHPSLRCWLAIVVLVMAHAVVQAQNATGTILGHVADPSGAVVPGVEVTIRNNATGIVQTAKTNNVGDYVYVNIQPGQYDITVAATGFKKAQAKSVTLNVDATMRQNFTLELGGAQEEVTVQAEAQMLQSDNATLGNVMETRLIESLPIQGRDFTNLLRVQAGATTVKGSSAKYWSQHGMNDDFSSVSINGARTESTSYLVDGITDNDQFFSTANNIPISDAIQEFKVQNGMYSAEYGQGSAQVNVALKSGGNTFHGAVYDYLQNGALQPRNPYYAYQRNVLGLTGVSLAKADLKQNQYGFNLSGPVRLPFLYNGKGKTFFFFGYEAARRRKSEQGKALVPSLKERGGDFSDWRDANGNLVPLYNPSTQTGNDPATRAVFSNNQLGSSLSSIAKNYMAIYPSPNVNQPNMAACAAANNPSSCANYIANIHRPYDTDNETFRIDHHFNEADHISLSAVLGEQTNHNAAIMPLTGEQKWQKNKLYAFNWQHMVSPTIFNEFRVGYNWQYWRNASDANSTNYSKELGFQNVVANADFWGVPILTLSGFNGIGNDNSNWNQKQNQYQFVENLKMIRGRHTLTFGTDIRRYLLNMTAAYGSTGTIGFNGAYTGNDPTITTSGPGRVGGGSAVADFLLGNPISVGAPAPGGSDLFNVRATAWNFFAQDDFRVTSRLTLNLGLRYELPPTYHSVNNSGVALDLTNGGSFRWASKSTYDLMKSISGVDPYLVGYTSNNKLVDSNNLNFAPRIGFAARPFASDRFVVRGGYGIFYDLQNLWYSLTTFDDISVYVGVGSYPTSSGYTSAAPTKVDTLWTPVGGDYSWFQNPYWKMGPQIMWPKNHSPYNQQWTMNFQFALTPSMLLDIGYVGSHAVHQPGYWYYNAGKMPSVDDPCNRYRSRDEAAQGNPSCLTNPNFVPVLSRANYPNIRSNAYALANIFSAGYNALQVRLNQRYQNGLQYQLNYTYSRAIDEGTAINNIEGSQLTLQNNNCARCDFGASSYDQTHRFVGSGSYAIPVGKGRKWSLGYADWVVGGWDFTGIYTVSSGYPFTVTNTGDSTLGQDGVRGDLRRPNLVGDPKGKVYGSLNTSKYQVANFKSNLYHWFNPAAYAVGAGNQYGNVGRNSLRGPYTMRGDITINKNFRVYKEQNLQYSLQIFNLFSTWHADPPFPSSTLSSNQFGSLVSMETLNGQLLPEKMQSGTRQLWNPRQIQMNLKYTF